MCFDCLVCVFFWVSYWDYRRKLYFLYDLVLGVGKGRVFSNYSV